MLSMPVDRWASPTKFNLDASACAVPTNLTASCTLDYKMKFVPLVPASWEGGSAHSS